jgi:cytoskeletal protein CcmA (bactofilin family)
MKNMQWMIGVLSIALLLTPGYSLVVNSGQTFDIKEDEIIDDDLIIFAQEVDIRGTVTGDVCVFAQDVTITGEIGGTIVAGASSIDIDPTSAKTVWAAAGNITISGDVTRNVVLAGGQLSVNEDAYIGRDFIGYGGKLTVEGDVVGEIRGGVGQFLMAGRSGDITLTAEQAKITSQARIAGDLIIDSSAEPVIEEGAVIAGEVKFEKREAEEENVYFALAPFIAFMITFIKIVVFVSKLIVGLLIIALFRGYTRRLIDTLNTATWKCLGWGFVSLIVIPVAIAILFMVLVGFPIAVFGTFIYMILLYLASIFVAMAIGEKIIQLFKKKGTISLYPAFIIGLIVLFVLCWIPILGFFVRLIVLLFGSGMIVLGTWNIMKEMKKKKLI